MSFLSAVSIVGSMCTDSIMRAMYRQMLLERLGTDWAEMPSYWPLQQHDAVISVPQSEGSPGPDGPSPQASVTVSFRFLCNAHPHAEAVLQDVLNSDVLVLNSGLWDLSVPVSSDGLLLQEVCSGGVVVTLALVNRTSLARVKVLVSTPPCPQLQ
jgi:hypothetical protein